jgi:2-keto-4-pentenoate hydratase/2-oxohepta-3-ene-1,7-dioic acid hydratase in catechol pathway
MAFPILDLLVYTARMMTLDPGDLILTGTPAGVAPLAEGDRVEVEIGPVGILSNPVEALRDRA